MRRSKTPGWVIPTLFVLIVPSVVWRGYVLSVLWAWFAVTQFEVSPLSIPAALGVSLLGSLFTGRWNSATNTDDETDPVTRFVTAVAEGFGGPLFVLLFAAIVRAFL